MLRYSDLAESKLKQLKDRPLNELSESLNCKCAALGFLGRYREQLECAKELYCFWNTKPTDVGAIDAAIVLIGSCLHNKEFADAHLYASTLYEIINHKYDNKIPDNHRQRYIAMGAKFLATAILRLAQDDGIPPEEKRKAAGQEAITLARKALEINTQLYGTEDENVAGDMTILGESLQHFEGNDSDEILRLYEQSKAIHSRATGSSSSNVAMVESKLGTLYYSRARRAYEANDHHLEKSNLELALSRFREAGRIYRMMNRIEEAETKAQNVVDIEELLQQCSVAQTAATTKG